RSHHSQIPSPPSFPPRPAGRSTRHTGDDSVSRTSPPPRFPHPPHSHHRQRNRPRLRRRRPRPPPPQQHLRTAPPHHCRSPQPHPGRPLAGPDQDSRPRGTRVSFPDRAFPMLPLELSTDICSLRPHVDRLVQSCIMEIDHRGDIVHYDLCEGVIRSAERMTYTDVNAVLEGDAEARQRYADLVSGFEMMRELALILNRKRERRGSIDFDLPEP